MKNLMTIIFISMLSVSGVAAQNENLNSITVNVSNLASNKGKAYIALYNAEGDFLNTIYKANFSKIKDGKCTLTFEGVPNGIYAVSMFHDVNDNNKMDTAIFGIPKEDYGCSNNATGFMGPPKWEDAKFEIHNKSITQNIQL